MIYEEGGGNWFRRLAVACRTQQKYELRAEVLLVKMRTHYSECFPLHHGFPTAARGSPAAIFVNYGYTYCKNYTVI